MALVGLILCCLLFVGYIVYSYQQSKSENQSGKIAKKQEEIINNGYANVVTVFMRELKESSSIQGGGKNFTAILRNFFDKYDADGSGTIDKTELANLYKDLGQPNLTKGKALHEQMKILDRDGSGTVDFDEFH